MVPIVAAIAIAPAPPVPTTKFVGGSPKDIRGIRIDKPSPDRVIVPAAEVVQARLGVVDIPAIAQGIHSTQRGRHGTADGHGRTPGVIGVGHHLGAAGVHKTGDIALGIFQVEIPVAVVRHGRRANGVVGKMQLVAAPCHLRQLVAQVGIIVRRTVGRLGNALAVGIVAVGDATAGCAHGRQLTAMLPGIRPIIGLLICGHGKNAQQNHQIDKTHKTGRHKTLYLFLPVHSTFAE